MPVATEITAILQSAQSPDASLRTQAEQQLKQFQEQNYAGFLYSLATELSNNDKPTDSRRLAGLILKNALDAKDEKRKAELAQQWLSLDAGLRQQIKQGLLTTLGAQDADARHTAALVVAKVAAIELPQSAWPELIQTLLNNMAVQPASSGLRQSTLEALGYVCEEMGNLKEDFLEQEQVNSILTAVVHGMRKDESDQEVRLAATTALYNALEFAHTNFENDQERNYLMQVVCEGTVSSEIRVRQASYECLVKIAGNYYEKLPPYMQHIFTLTHKAVKEDEQEVALQAIEFWSTVCDEEIDIEKDQEDSAGGLVHHHFIQNALPHLVPMLLEQLTKQEEGQDQDDGSWNLSMAAGTCLELVANTVGDAVVALVMPYVQENINKNVTPDDWRWREAATFAFGSILEGPSIDELARLVNMGLGFLLNAMKDPNSQVRSTTAWTIGRIFEFVHGNEPNPPIVTVQTLPQIVQVLLDSIKDEPYIAEKVCYALSQLFVGFKDHIANNPMSLYFQNVVQALLETAARPCEVHDQAKLQVAAFVAIQEVVRTASPDTLQLVAQLIPVLLGKLNETLLIPIASAEDRERQTELQGLLCGGLQVTIQRLSEDKNARPFVLQVSDQIMEVLLHVFNQHATVHEEAMLVVGALTDAVGTSFIKYMERFFPVLERGLTHSQDWHACLITVGALGDISRAIGKQLSPYCDRIMNLLILNLRSNEVHRNVKPPILSCFGDIALAIEEDFINYLTPVLEMLHSAQQLSVAQQQSGDEEYFDYNNLLRHGILEAYAGIFNGLPQQLVNQHMTVYARHIIDYIEFVYNDKDNVDEGVIKAAVAIIGDVARQVAGAGQLFVQRAFVQQFVHECKTSGDVALVETATWTSTMLSKATAA